MKKAIEVFDYLFILRLTSQYATWTFFLAGYWGGRQLGKGIDPFMHPGAPFWVVAGLTLVMGGVYILNQIQDVETDRVNGKLFFVAQGIISVKEAYWETFLLVSVGVALGFWMDLRVGVLFLILLILTGWLYNYPPASWKNRPIMGFLTNGAGAFLVYSTGWIVGGGGGLVHPRVVAYVSACIAVYLNTTLPDVEGDRKTGKYTFGAQYGFEKTVILSLVFEITALLWAFLFKDWLLFFPALAVFPLYLITVVRRRVADAVRATKFSILSLMVAVTVVYPWYLLPTLGVFFLCKWYYRRRFGLDYPNLRTS